MIESMKNVQIQIVDGPFVGSLPTNKDPLLLIGIGLLGGFVMGVAVSLVREVLSRKVRSIQDVVCDLSIPVVAVIPKR